MISSDLADIDSQSEFASQEEESSSWAPPEDVNQLPKYTVMIKFQDVVILTCN